MQESLLLLLDHEASLLFTEVMSKKPPATVLLIFLKEFILFETISRQCMSMVILKWAVVEHEAGQLRATRKLGWARRPVANDAVINSDPLERSVAEESAHGHIWYEYYFLGLFSE